MRVLSFSLVVALLAACGDDGSKNGGAPAATVTPGPKGVVRVEIVASKMDPEIGDPVALIATAFNASGAVVPVPEGDPTIKLEWVVTNPKNARVSITNELVAFEPGEVEVTATIDGIQGVLKINARPGSTSFGDGSLHGTNDNDGGEKIVVDAKGNVYIAGSTAGTLEGQPAAGTSDAFVTRFLPNGKRAWSVLIGTNEIDGAHALTLHPDGGVVVSATNPFSSEVVRVNAAGMTAWSRRLGGAGVTDLATDKEGNIWAVGDAQRGFNDGGATDFSKAVGAPLGQVNTAGASDGFVVQLSPKGSVMRGKLFSWISSDQDPGSAIPAFATTASALVIDDAAGAIYISGVTQANAFYGLSAWARRLEIGTLNETWLRFINRTGVAPMADSTDWNNNVPTAGGYGHSIATGPDGSIFVGGSFNDNTPFVSALSAMGTETWRTLVPLGVEGELGAVMGLQFRPKHGDVIALTTIGATSLVHSNHHSGALLKLAPTTGTESSRRVLGYTSTAGSKDFTTLRAIAKTEAEDIVAVGDTAGSFGTFTAQKNPKGLPTLDVLIAHFTADAL